MDAAQFKNYLPTLNAWWEKRRKERQNRLPRHLRPAEIWPIWIQIALNTGLILTLCNLMIDRDDYLTEAGPAIIMIIAFLFLSLSRPLTNVLEVVVLEVEVGASGSRC